MTTVDDLYAIHLSLYYSVPSLISFHIILFLYYDNIHAFIPINPCYGLAITNKGPKRGLSKIKSLVVKPGF